MATKGSDMAALVRVPWNDPVLIKPVLDIGANGIVSPLVRTVKDVELAVAVCLYPPKGIRGFGPCSSGRLQAGENRHLIPGVRTD